MDIKLLLLDLDGTLLNSREKLSQRTAAAVKNAVNNDIIVVLASGRMHASLLPYAEALNTQGPIISCNGALIKDSFNGQKIYSNPVPIKLAREVLNFASNNDMYCQFYTDKDYFIEKHCALSEQYFEITGIKGIELGGKLSEKIIEDPPKLLMIDYDKNKVKKVFGKLKKEFDNFLYITQSKSQYIEIMNKYTNKGAALLKICEIFNINPSDCMAIGDGLNDLEMIQNAGVGVAVGSAVEELKKAADIVCDTADDDGPAKIIEKYILNN